MDDSREPGNSEPAKYPWQDTQGVGENLGATGVFRTTPESSIDGGPGPATQVGQEANPGGSGELRGSAPQAPAPANREGLQEPIVHKVVLGGGSATAPNDLLELLRTNSRKAEPAAPASQPAEPQAPPRTAAFQSTPQSPESPRGPSSEGFTQLLRALGGAPASSAKQPEAVLRTVTSSDSLLARPESGFTESVRAPNSDDLNEQPEKRPDLRAPTPGAPPSDGTGDFTALLQGFSGNAPNSGARPPNSRTLDENPRPILPTDTPSAPAYASGQAAPGSFTQLFSTQISQAAQTAETNPAGANPAGANRPPTYSERNSVAPPSGRETSFTQLISTTSQAPSRASTYGDNRPSVLQDLSRRPPPPEPSSVSGSVTQLLSVLDGPAKSPETPAAYPSAGEPRAPSPAGGSFLTQTYKKLDEPMEPLSSAPPPPYSPGLSATQVYQPPSARGTYSEAPMPSVPAGPSEVTRIFDQSKLREMQRQGMSSPAVNPAAPAQPLPAPVSAPAAPAPPNLPWRPPTPPTPAAWPPPYAPPAVPAPQVPAPAPVAAPTPSAPPAMLKMQQYLPLLLIVIIFLLIVILVTVVFLLKH